MRTMSVSVAALCKRRIRLIGGERLLLHLGRATAVKALPDQLVAVNSLR
jgi:hypothetical protein